jgi:hypothetical protein
MVASDAADHSAVRAAARRKLSRMGSNPFQGRLSRRFKRNEPMAFVLKILAGGIIRCFRLHFK